MFTFIHFSKKLQFGILTKTDNYYQFLKESCLMIIT